MAISADAAILAMLKRYYAKNGVENLLFRNSPLLNRIKKERVEGKTQNFSAMYGRGGAVGGNYQSAIANATSTTKSVEFEVTPGQLFSVYTVNAKEVQASKTQRGAYMNVAGVKMFAASEAFRKTMAASIYGAGHGELQVITLTEDIAAAAGNTLTLNESAIMAIDIGTNLVLKSDASTSTIDATLVVTAIDGNVITFTSDTAVATGATKYICIAGSTEADDTLLPMGLDGWLPTVGNRSGAEWQAYISTPFFGVDRSAAPDRLAGQFYNSVTGEKKASTIKNLIMKCRRAGSKCDLIVMNDADFLEFADEVESTNTYFTQTSTKSKREANIGFDKFSASFSTNYIENIIDDPFCPKGKVYVLDSDAVEFWSYTNADKTNDGITNNDPGKADPMSDENNGQEDSTSKLIIDDYLNVQPGTNTTGGPSLMVSLMFYGSLVVTNPSNCGVGLFAA